MAEPRTVRLAGLVALGLTMSAWLLACGQTGQGNTHGGDTHWLSTCAPDVPCTEGVCQCGVCTTPCEGDRECGVGPGGSCVDLDSDALADHCGGWLESDLGGACLGECSASHECGAQQTCVAGVCVVQGAASGPVRPGLHPSDFAGVDLPVRFDRTYRRPVPDFAVAGDAQALVGRWAGPCTYDGCFVLDVIERAGQVEAALTRTDSEEPAGWQECEYWPALDPDDAPAASDLPSASSIACDMPYRLFDAHFEDGLLTAAISLRQPWNDWCEQQKSFEVVSDEYVQYQCTPADAPERDEKRALCDIAAEAERCASFNLIAPGCFGGTPCDCDRDGCGASWSERRLEVSTRVERTRMPIELRQGAGILGFGEALALEKQP